MKKVLIVLVLCGLTTGCGITDRFNEACTGVADNLCQAFFGLESDLESDVLRNKQRIQDAEYRILRLEQDFLNLRFFAEEIEQELSEAIQQGFQDLEQELRAELQLLEADLVLVASDLAGLELGKQVVDFIDPCGDMPGQFDEILLQTADGSLVAYFKDSGSREFLTLLAPGSYRTTDKQKCDFDVLADGSYYEAN